MAYSLDQGVDQTELISDTPRPTRWQRAKPIIRRLVTEGAWLIGRAIAWRYLGPEIEALIPIGIQSGSYVVPLLLGPLLDTKSCTGLRLRKPRHLARIANLTSPAMSAELSLIHI